MTASAWTRKLLCWLTALTLTAALAGPAAAAEGVDKPKVKALASGIAHTLALLENGTVMAWGDNAYGQVGDGTRSNFRSSPVKVAGLSNVIAVAGGKDHSLALKQDGTVWAWGANYDGQLGIGSRSERERSILTDHDSAIPVQVAGLSQVVAIAAGWSSNYALRRDGTVWSWGSNMSGGLGIGDPYKQVLTTPAAIPGLADVASVSAGWNHGHAVKIDGTAWSWGYNESANAGDGTVTVTKIEGGVMTIVKDENKHTPVEVAGNHRFVQIAPMHNGGNYALKADGTVWYWGVILPASRDNRQFELTPIQVPGLSGVKALYAVAEGVYALKKDGTVWTTKSTHLDFGQMNLPKTASVAAGGWFHALALAEDGSVWAWGSNDKGQLGDGTTSYRSKAKPVRMSVFYSPETMPVLFVDGKASGVKLDVDKGYPALNALDAVKLIGAKLAYDKKTKIYKITRGKSTLELSAGSVNAKANGKAMKLKHAPAMAGGMLWIPASALDSLGVRTKWDAELKRLDINVQ